MLLATDEKAKVLFKELVERGSSISKIRSEFKQVGYSLQEYSDVQLIRLWRSCTQEG